MNTGIQDAINLAWKVALTWKGVASPALIATYQEERHPIAARVLKLSGRALRMAATKSRLGRGLQDVAMAVLTHIPKFRQTVTNLLAEDDVTYLDSSLAGEKEGRAKPGTALPDVPVQIGGQSCSATHLLRTTKPGAAFTLILMRKAQPASWISSPLLQEWQLGRDFQDPDGHLEKVLGLHADCGLLVRPDAIIAASGSPASLQNWFDQWMLTERNGND